VAAPSPTSPRARLLQGMAASVRAKGFQHTTLADVVREAHVSRRTFYEHFRDPLDCYVALLGEVAEGTVDAITAAADGGGTPVERLDRAVGSYLDLLEADPQLLRSFLRELHLTGEPGLQLLSRVNDRVGHTIVELVDEARALEPELVPSSVPVPMARMLAAGIAQMALIAQDEGRPLDEVRDTATALIERVVRAGERPPDS
jgi:AcrR family transcriptional regulator